MFLPRLIIFSCIFSIKVSKIRFYLLHSGVMRIKVFPFDSVFILFFKEKASLIWKYKDVIIFHADYGDPISTEYGHIAMIVSAYASGKQIRYKTVGANNHGKLKLKDEYNCSNISIPSPARTLIVNKVSIYRKWLSSLKKMPRSFLLGIFHKI